MRRFGFFFAMVFGVASGFAQSPTAPAADATTNRPATDYGPFFMATIRGAANNMTPKGIVVTVGEEKRAYLCYDEDLLRVSVGWTGEWLRTGNYLREINHPKPPDVGGTQMFKTPYGLPGWVKGNALNDPRATGQGPVPKDYAHYRGLYRDGDNVVLSYSVGSMDVLERPGFTKSEGVGFFTRTIQVNKLEPEWGIIAAEGIGEPIVAGTAIASVEGDRCVAVAVNGGGKTRLEYVAGKLIVRITGNAGETSLLQLAVWAGATTNLPKFLQANPGQLEVQSLQGAKKGGPARWPQTIETRGTLGNPDAAYAVDNITEPVPNPWNTRTFFGGFDFFPDGRAVVCTFHGDVWIVSGLDEGLNKVTWKRFASGMFQPLGVKIVEGKIYVTCRDALVRLHDLNNDGEADFYENFNNDSVVTPNYHEFSMDLQTDSEGNFYYFKGSPWEPDVRTPHQGTCLKVSKDGSKLEVFATGFRAPNGSGMGPNDLLTVSDNQGHWIPSSKLNVVKGGGFYGMTPAAHRELELIAGVAVLRINPSKPDARATTKLKAWNEGAPQPATYDQPLCWLPTSADNSSGGQVWSTSAKWGPLANHMLFMSYGRGTLFEVMMEEVEGTQQAAMVRLPLKLTSGAMRGRENPRDGQIYVCGLRGWQTDALKEGGFYRIRYTGKPARMPVKFHVKPNGVAITFSDALDEAAAKDIGNYNVEAWNYLYSGAYGSADYSAENPGKKGRDKVEVKSASLSADKKTVTLEMPVKPVNQLRIKFGLKSADGAPVSHEIFSTIHKVPSQRAALN